MFFSMHQGCIFVGGGGHFYFRRLNLALLDLKLVFIFLFSFQMVNFKLVQFLRKSNLKAFMKNNF